tara:strand:+ start:1053 stop:2936 length:1884 start_codon:yes stop_codon:yes gene_type:complete
MSLVLLTNKDQDNTFRQEESVYSAFSFKNALSSTYKIPPNSQVALQSCKVNLDGRLTITGANSWWYDYFGEDLESIDNKDASGDEVEEKIDCSLYYPKLQDLDVRRGEILELTTDEMASRIKEKHREYHPNLKGKFSCSVKRNSGLDFLGYSFGYNQDTDQNASKKPTSAEPFFQEDVPADFTWNASTYQLHRKAGDHERPAVGILLGTPLSLSNGKMRVNFSNANASSVPWGAGLSRDCPNPYLNENEEYKPYYFDKLDDADESLEMDNMGAWYFEDFGVHRNESDELVLRHAVPSGDYMVYKEVKYWTNSNSDLSGAGRYDLDDNSGNYEWIEFHAENEKMSVYIGHAGAKDLITEFDVNEPKDSYFKPIAQTSWCLHPVLFVGKTDTAETNHIHLTTFSGLDIADYNSRDLDKCGWFEQASLLSNIANWNAIGRCRSVDLRLILDPTETDDPYDYEPQGLNPGNNSLINKYAMILRPNNLYFPTFGSACADLFGFEGRSLVMDGSGTFPAITFESDSAPSLNCMKSIFVRLNGFGQQLLNARTGNKSTILSHLPTADSRASDGTSQRIFYEPKNLIWLDLNNSYELQVSDFSVDFVYSNEQYAKILQGQSVVMLYFREKGKMME